MLYVIAMGQITMALNTESVELNLEGIYRLPDIRQPRRRRNQTPAHIVNVQSLLTSLGKSQVVDITPV